MKTHTGERSFQCHDCTECSKAFSQQGHLQTHMMKHNGEKPHVFTICDKGFNQKGNLKTHNRIHHGEKRFKKRAFSEHVRNHSGEKIF